MASYNWNLNIRLLIDSCNEFNATAIFGHNKNIEIIDSLE